MKTSGKSLHKLTTTALLLGSVAGLGAAGAEPADNIVPDNTVASLTSPVEPAPLGLQAIPATASVTSSHELRLNFRGVPLRLVLDYLSDAAGYVIDQQAEVRGTVDVWSKDTVTKEEAVALLNAALRRNGYAAVRNGRILTIVPLDNIKTADLEVVTGNNPDQVQASDEVVTQIIPVRYATASLLVNNLQPLLPASASLSVNESANSLILVDAKKDIRRMLKIISALDNSIATVSTLKVFLLHYADAKQLAPTLQQLFSPQSSSQTGNQRSQLFNFPGGPGGFGPSGFGEQANQTASASGNSGNVKVTVTADEYANALIVSSPAGLLPSISNIVQQIDQPVTDITELRVFQLHNADPTEVVDQISQLFPDSSKSSSEQNQPDFRFGPFPGPPGSMTAGTSTQSSSDRSKKKSQVLAAADRRSNSVLVSAPSTLMPTLANMVARLDANPARKELVQVYDLHNAEPQDIRSVLTDLFNRNNSQRTSTGNSQTGENNPLNSRETETQSNPTSSTGGNNSGGTRAGGGSSTTGGF